MDIQSAYFPENSARLERKRTGKDRRFEKLNKLVDLDEKRDGDFELGADENEKSGNLALPRGRSSWRLTRSEAERKLVHKPEPTNTE